MTDKEKLDAIRAEIHRLIEVRGYDREMANDLLAFMDSLPNEPVSDFEMALTEMIDKAQKCVVEPIVVAQQWKDYLVELAKSEEPISEEWIKELRTKLDSMSKEDFKKVFDKYAVDFNEEPVSDGLEKIVEEITEPTVLNAYGTKELARRLRNTVIYGTSVSKELDEVAELYTLDDTVKPWRNLTKEAFKAGANWQKLQDMGITNNKAQDVVANVLSSADNPLDAYATEVAFIMLPATLKESYHQTNRDRIGDAVRLGAKWQKQKTIDKACEYLDLHCNEVKTEDNGIAGWIDNEFINNFKQAMKETKY